MSDLISFIPHPEQVLTRSNDQHLVAGERSGSGDAGVRRAVSCAGTSRAPLLREGA